MLYWLSHLTNANYKSIGYEVECHYWIAHCCYNLGDFEQASKHVKKALDLRDQRDATKEMEGPLEDYDAIVEKAVALYGTIIMKMVNQE